MIIKYNLFEKKVASLNNTFFLFYGANTGKIESCIEFLKTSQSNLNIINFYSEDFSSLSFSEIIKKNNQDDIFGNNNCLIFSLSDLKSSNEILKFVDKKDLNLKKIIFKSGPIQKNIKFRKVFEDSQDNVCVPCYEDTYEEKKEVIYKLFKRENLQISENEIDELASFLSSERLDLINDLKKIIIHTKITNKSIKDSLSIISENQSDDINKVIYSLASRKKKVFWNEFSIISNSLKDEIKFINILSIHLEKILIVKKKISDGHSPFHALKTLKPPIFFKLEKEFLKQTEIWEEKELTQAIKKLHLCLVSFFKNEKSSESYFLHLLIKILR